MEWSGKRPGIVVVNVRTISIIGSGKGQKKGNNWLGQRLGTGNTRLGQGS